METKTVDQAHIRACLKNGEPIVFRFRYVNPDDKIFINDVLSVILGALNKNFMSNNLQYAMQEMVDNANKALLKRVYFDLSGLNINDPETYASAMKLFSGEYLKNEETFIAGLANYNVYVELQFQIKNAYLTITIKNKGLPTPEELNRIKNRIAISSTIRRAGEAFGQLSDRTEGAGLGTALTILLLRQITNNPDGVDSFEFNTDKNAGETIVLLTIALNTLPEKFAEELSDTIAKEISTIPLYPENLQKIERMLSDRELSLSPIAAVIERDPALTAELLRTINSAQYYLPQKVKTILNAVSLIGIKGIKNLILSLGAKRIVERRYGKQEQLWEHAHRSACYAILIARDFNKPDLVDDVYIGGILHDIGEIIIRSVDSKLSADISGYCRSKGIAGDSIEQLTIGCSSAKIGAHILRKWQFPEGIVNAVEFSGQPLLAPAEWKDMVEIVYLADRLAMLYDKKIQYAALEPSVFKKFKLETVAAIREYSESLGRRYAEKEG